MTTIVRAQVAHTPRDPFVQAGALEAFEDGAVAFADGRIVGCGAYGQVSGRFPGAEVLDARDAVLLPGFVDCHVHYPQIRVIGAMGLELMDWLRLRALPEEVRLADEAYAAEVAERFVRGLVANGTTTALVFGSTSRAPRRRCSRPRWGGGCGSRAGSWSLTGVCRPPSRCPLRPRWSGVEA